MMQVAENEADQRRFDTFTTFPAPLFRADIQFQTFEATAVVPVLRGTCVHLKNATAASLIGKLVSLQKKLSQNLSVSPWETRTEHGSRHLLHRARFRYAPQLEKINEPISQVEMSA